MFTSGMVHYFVGLSAGWVVVGEDVVEVELGKIITTSLGKG